MPQEPLLCLHQREPHHRLDHLAPELQQPARPESVEAASESPASGATGGPAEYVESYVTVASGSESFN